MKTTDVSLALRPFTKLFNQLAYRHDDARVFDDYLTAMLNYFTFTNDPTYNTECFSKYTKEERQLFMPMIIETIQVIKSKISSEKGSWYDFFGEFYQQLVTGHGFAEMQTGLRQIGKNGGIALTQVNSPLVNCVQEYGSAD